MLLTEQSDILPIFSQKDVMGNMKIYVFRHGETDWNAVHRIQGREDIPLNANGIAQADAAGRGVKGKIFPEYMVVSPLSRAKVTGEIIAGYIGIDRIYVEEDLTECDYGNMSGKIVEDIYDAVCPDEEPREIAGARFLRVLDKYTSLYDSDFAVVSHGGTINAALYCISDGAMGTGVTKLKNAAVTVLQFEGGKYSVLRTNITAEDF